MNKSGHRYNVQEQQKVYAEEKERIWNAQMRSLSRTDPPELTDDEDESKGKSRDSPAPADGTQPDAAGSYRVMKIRRWVSVDKHRQLRCAHGARVEKRSIEDGNCSGSARHYRLPPQEGANEAEHAH
jgi:hypothetical protein